jgi:riboflavin synthase
MFTGIVEEVGKIGAVAPLAKGVRVTVACRIVLEGTGIGDSISVSGVCLTATAMGPDFFAADVSPETLRVTTLGALKAGDAVNLERALALGERLGGHLVTGHVDGLGALRRVTPAGEATELWYDAPPEVLALCVVKGSIAVDGVSLTVNALDRTGFSVMIIPHTAEQTTLLKAPRGAPVGTKVNLEADLIGKYVARLMEGRESGGGLTAEALSRL